MCPNKKGIGSVEMDNTNNEDSDSESISDSSDVSMSEDEIIEYDTDNNDTLNDTAHEAEPEEEEDEVIKAIRRENHKQRDHPPVIECEDFITDLSFHPHEDLLAVATINGDVVVYRYTNEENTIVNTWELHTKATRDIEFNQNGDTLFSVGKDKAVMLTNMETGKLVRFYEGAHEVPIYCINIIDENLFATGDDDGYIKLWDLRTNNGNSIFTIKKNEDYISDIITNETKKYLLCCSGDGSLTAIDLQNRQLFTQSEEYDEELTSLGLFRSETKLLASSSKGKLILFNWNEFGLHSDIFPGPKTAINSLIPITENIVVTANEDGNIRATHLFPHRHLGIVGQHNLSVENLDICNSGQFIASSSHDNDIKFWNIQYFEDFEKISHKHNKHNKRKELENNLPSSKRTNVSDFFNDLC